MQKCCDHTIIPFTNAAVVNIAYSANMRNRFGSVPHIKVYHQDPDTGEQIEPMIAIKIDGRPTTNIVIDNGGMATGFVKLFK